MESLAKRIETKVRDLLKVNKKLRQKVQDLSCENEELTQKQSETELQMSQINDQLENLLGSLEEATRELGDDNKIEEEENVDAGVYQSARPIVRFPSIHKEHHTTPSRKKLFKLY